MPKADAFTIWQRTTCTEQQSLHKSGLLCVIYAILNPSVILKRNETRLARNKTRLARNETRLVTNETRGGKLPLRGTVPCSYLTVLGFSAFILKFYLSRCKVFHCRGIWESSKQFNLSRQLTTKALWYTNAVLESRNCAEVGKISLRSLADYFLQR